MLVFVCIINVVVGIYLVNLYYMAIKMLLTIHQINPSLLDVCYVSLPAFIAIFGAVLVVSSLAMLMKKSWAVVVAQISCLAMVVLFFPYLYGLYYFKGNVFLAARNLVICAIFPLLLNTYLKKSGIFADENK
ncbi:hypothetical protein [Candidatus Uabimicrobium amorphum]|uniref:Uncharacterized protein n=1 Tax=Uabimicrobium amorphum TaxID=2596890 RepID=A0A5S9IU78_UABAM|nr:hypothetical protein [Candidatus Uabimicrobium amorphum]BBM88199.1 hypothetical protein UABAM_06620 [Candidatus Uabimicrobium amorphum]